MLGDIVGGFLGLKGADKAADAQIDAARIAAEQFKPYNVAGPLATLNVNGKQIGAKLRPGAEQLRQQFRQEARGSVDDRAADLYGRLSALSARDEADIRRQTEAGLFRSGRLGTYGGMRMIGEVEGALSRARLQREFDAISMANNMRQQAFQNFLTLSQAPTQALGGLATARNPGAGIAAAGYLNAGNTRGAATAGAYNALGQGISSAINNSGVGSWFNDQIGNIFSSGGTPTPGVYQNMGGFAGPPMEFAGPPAFLMGG